VRVLVFLGPSASGKSTVVRELHRRGLIEVTPSWTTRPRRADEQAETVEHRFVSEEEFTARQREGLFLETVTMFGLPYRYGLPAVGAPGDHGRVPAIMVRAPLLPLVARHFPDHVAYQIEDRYERVPERLARRGGSDAELGTRLEGYEDERRQGRALTHRTFVNAGSVEELIDAVAAAVQQDFAISETEETCRSAG
jgi:guanylate kinase